MIKEIAQFTDMVLKDSAYSNFGVTPKDGLHIVLKVEQTEEQITIAETPAFFALFNAKKSEMTPELMKCTQRWKYSTMLGTVDTFKVFDVPSKAIHTVSPFCIGLKRTNLEGGEQYALNHSQNKSQVYERIDSYFAKAMPFTEEAQDQKIAEAFRIAFKNKSQIERWLQSTGVYNDVKDGDYVVFYLDIPTESYERVSKKFLKEKLFNTDKYNKPDQQDESLIHGTSNWLNGFPGKKVFLQHQSATFDIAGRISSREAELLSEFSEMSRRRLFPNPLPLFIFEEELDNSIKLYKDDAMNGAEQRKGYLDIIKELRTDKAGELGNYYLLFQSRGEIKDFDFVSKFEYNLELDGHTPWKIIDLFGTNQSIELYNVSDLISHVLPPIFNNALVVSRKDKDWIFRWFDDIDPAYCKTHNAFLMAMKYRKAFYDFIYKSQRQSVTGAAFEEIVLTGIRDDIRLDKYESGRNSEGFHLKTKLNILFSLHPHFSNNKNSIYMASKIESYREKLELIAEGQARIETDEEFAFAAGQVIYRIFSVSVTEDRSYSYLEPFLAQANENGLKNCITQFFKRYKHGNFSKRFALVFDDVMTYSLDGSYKHITPLLLAGVFSPNMLFKAKEEQTAETTENQPSL